MHTAFEIAEMDAPEAVTAIRKGLPADDFDHVASALNVSSGVLATILRISMRTIRYQKEKGETLSSENSEKLVRVARVHGLAKKIFVNDEAIKQWLSTPAPALDGLKPFDLLDTDTGAREVEATLNGIAYGNVM